MADLLNTDKQNIAIAVPADVRQILSVLENDGNQAYVVGGCVRDCLLGKMPKDWDVTTSALPMQVKALFKRTVDTGIKHGTVTVLMGGSGYEVTTYRIDGDYADGRHPDSVEFSLSLTDDLKRRDFTINAMAYNSSSGLVDEFDGIGDLKRGIVKCVGKPEERFAEDALRMMRAVRFSAQLGFDIDAATLSAVREMSPGISKVSMERIHDELGKTLMSDAPERVRILGDTGLTRHVLPVLDSILNDRKCSSTLGLLRHSGRDIIFRYAALYNSVPYEDVERELRNLKLDNNTINTVTKLVKLSKVGIDETEPAVREAIHMYGREFIPMMITHQQAIVDAREEFTGIKMSSAHKHISVIKRFYDAVMERGDCISVKDLDIDGNDLQELGISGPRIGETLNKLLHIVMENPRLNDKATLIAMIDVI